ncbi:MAG: class I SAM-dependent methyltransferase [Thermotoga caldifontis]|uniref:class I SAM-dependent methyltransferase n=1 Tax=Thermotoga TaxID=2335 RepID=UPI0013EBAEEB|nr:class I SAM-dependent methyltransferase [Thermotoga sp. Ku-13t]KAF2957425.1 methyltransferase [Thermotoga sp. Ku-13t]
MSFKDVFAEIAHDYESWYETPLGSFVIKEEEKALKKLIPAGERLLEIGAGTGWWLRRLNYPVMVAVEPSTIMLEIGRKNVPSAQWICAKGEELPLHDESFDVVLIFTTLEFVQDPQKVLNESLRVLKQNGALVVGILNGLSPWVALYRKLSDRGVKPWSHARFYTKEDLIELLGPCESEAEAVFLSPNASPPYEEANLAGVRAGNCGAIYVAMWRKK